MDIWKQRKQDVTTSMWRDPYSRDRARIIHSAFFRRLQGKTQVLGLGESDFYRTRLTHSIEVAQIASGITEFLKYKYPTAVPNEIYPTTPLIESISLIHDIGHPPFGHGGEVALNYMMRNKGGFEGNAQTLRIATKLGESSNTDGLNLTRRTLLGLIKYPYFYSKIVGENPYDEKKLHSISHHSNRQNAFSTVILKLFLLFSSIFLKRIKLNSPHQNLQHKKGNIKNQITKVLIPQ